MMLIASDLFCACVCMCVCTCTHISMKRIRMTKSELLISMQAFISVLFCYLPWFWAISEKGNQEKELFIWDQSQVKFDHLGQSNQNLSIKAFQNL